MRFFSRNVVQFCPQNVGDQIHLLCHILWQEILTGFVHVTFFFSIIFFNKKVLRERKRHNARRVASTRWAALSDGDWGGRGDNRPGGNITFPRTTYASGNNTVVNNCVILIYLFIPGWIVEFSWRFFFAKPDHHFEKILGLLKKKKKKQKKKQTETKRKILHGFIFR